MPYPGAALGPGVPLVGGLGAACLQPRGVWSGPMSAGADADVLSNVERISISSQPTAVSDELARLTGMLREVCPRDAAIGFEYDGKLHLHVYVRRSEDVTRVETILPSLSGGIFHSVHRGKGRQSFQHRVSALVER